jgi:hypothetical protein
VKSNFSKYTNHLQSKFTIIRPKNYKKSLLCGPISQTLAEMPPKNGGMRKANSECYLLKNTSTKQYNTRIKIKHKLALGVVDHTDLKNI